MSPLGILAALADQCRSTPRRTFATTIAASAQFSQDEPDATGVEQFCERARELFRAITDSSTEDRS